MGGVFSPRGLAVGVWASVAALEGVLAGMAATGRWHPHFLPVVPLFALVLVATLALVVGGTWRLIRGPGRWRSLAWLLIGMAPAWLLAGHLVRGYAAKGGRNHVPDPLLRPLIPLGDAVLDAEARVRYPMRTYGAKVVMLSEAMPGEQARAQVAAMDRHVGALEARLDRPAGWVVRWARGPLLGEGGKSHRGLSLGSRPGELGTDAEGLAWMDRHEVAHGVIAGLCPPTADPPAVLVEGWAAANMGNDPVEQAGNLKSTWERGNGYTLRQLVWPKWYHRHQGAAYGYGGPLVDFLLRRFGPAKFLELYTTTQPQTFDADCRRILGLDVDGLDGAMRAEVDRIVAEVGSLDRHRLRRLRVAPGVDADGWRAFLADYFDSAGRLLAANRQVRLRVVVNRSDDDVGETSFEQTSLRSGEFAALKHRTPYHELAQLSHPRRSILARRDAADRTWRVEDESRRTPEQARRRALHRIDLLDAAGPANVAPLLSLSEDLTNGEFVVAAFDRFTEAGRPRVRVRIEDRSPPGERANSWRSATYVLAADDHHAALVERVEGDGPKGATSESEFVYDRVDGWPTLRSKHTRTSGPDGSRGTIDLEVVERRAGPIAEAEFDPDRFLDGPRETEAPENPFADMPSKVAGWERLAVAIGASCLVVGVAISVAKGKNPAGLSYDGG